MHGRSASALAIRYHLSPFCPGRRAWALEDEYHYTEANNKTCPGQFYLGTQSILQSFLCKSFLSTDVNKIRREPLLLSALLQAQKWKVWEFEDSSKSGSDVSITRGPAYSRLCVGAAS